MQVKVGTYNVKNMDRGLAIDALAKEIRENEIDIVGVQEGDVETARCGGLNTIRMLSHGLEMPYYGYFPAIQYGGGQYGIAIVSRYPIVAQEMRFLQSYNTEQRVLAYAAILVDGENIHLFNTHLALETTVRKEQFEYLSRILRTYPSFILTGDFNISSMAEYEVLGDALFANSANQPIHTFKAAGAIDNIIVSRNYGMRNVYLSVTPQSDHNMLCATIIN